MDLKRNYGRCNDAFSISHAHFCPLIVPLIFLQFHCKTEIIRYSKENLTVCQKYGISSSKYRVGNHIDSIMTILPGSKILKLSNKTCTDQPLIILPPHSTISSVEELSQYRIMSSSSIMVRENFEKNGFNKVKISRASPSS